MEYEYKSVLLPFDETIQAEADKLAAEGWQTVQGAPPMVQWNLVRQKGVNASAPPMAGAFAQGKMLIDEDKVFIRGADGSIRKN